MKKNKCNKHVGSSLEDFLDEESIREEVDAAALCKVLAQEWREKMKRDNISIAMLARRMNTTRATVSRVISPQNSSLTFRTAARVSNALGMCLKVCA